MYIYAEDKDTFVYEVTEDGAKAIDATWNEDYEAAIPSTVERG